jgi:hypothetical protein
LGGSEKSSADWGQARTNRGTANPLCQCLEKQPASERSARVGPVCSRLALRGYRKVVARKLVRSQFENSNCGIIACCRCAIDDRRQSGNA